MECNPIGGESMCEYCDKNNKEESLRGDDGVVYDEKESRHYLFIEHFYREVYRIEVNYCPECGRKLTT